VTSVFRLWILFNFYGPKFLIFVLGSHSPFALFSRLCDVLGCDSFYWL
jgi:hypothetical protein